MMNKGLLAMITSVALLMPMVSLAEWTLDGAHSSLGFVSIKNGLIVESHDFKNLSGSIEADGDAELVIDLNSVDTLIPIRNERIRAMLFNTEKYAEAVVRIPLDIDRYSGLKIGANATDSVKGTLYLNGITAEVMTSVIVVRGKSHVVVSSVKPMILNAAQWGLVPGIEALRAIANLTSITPAVPVSFSLKYNLDVNEDSPSN
ncbi:MAG: polyisoprenoid-binding protein YceI [Dinoroseobacter sp.]|jgi:polyisoprenoid-binding protein YceI